MHFTPNGSDTVYRPYDIWLIYVNSMIKYDMMKHQEECLICSNINYTDDKTAKRTREPIRDLLPMKNSVRTVSRQTHGVRRRPPR